MNNYGKFKKLFNREPIKVVSVELHLADGRSQVRSATGAVYLALGQSVAPGQKAYVRGLEIIGQAPNLTTVTLYLPA